MGQMNGQKTLLSAADVSGRAIAARLKRLKLQAHNLISSINLLCRVS